jgi:serine/threonine-protein kinase SRPK3
LLEGKRLFEAVDPHSVDEYDDQKHLAYITALLGPPPKDLLDVGDRTSMFYDCDSEYKGVFVYLNAYTQKGI